MVENKYINYRFKAYGTLLPMRSESEQKRNASEIVIVVDGPELITFYVTVGWDKREFDLELSTSVRRNRENM
ncbi:jg8926 [Pararge aegeria aegeria]|uniref:Jg8926 protein n=1 Tax=Pararge aegeria aegeria TaxID=348720 RepID=A0A8S4SDT9_9NEOP|nr:jg8926 [Pararge aegeria aegeria]